MIYLMRHGKDNEDYIGGWSEIPLTKEGVLEVTETAEFLNNSEKITIDKIISSSIKRAIQTADIVSPLLGIKEFEISDMLKEQSKGHLNGMEKNVAKHLYSEYTGNNVKVDTIYPDGESLENLYTRIKNNLEYFASLEDNTLLITHRGVINMLYYIFNDLGLDMDKEKFGVNHASVHECDIKNKTIRKVI